MKHKLVKGLAAICALGALVSCADDSQTQTASVLGEGARCFKPSDVTSFNQLSDTSFVVHTLRGNVFSADLPLCRGIDWAQQVALRPVRSTQICETDAATLLTSDPGGHVMSCNVSNVHQMSPAEVATLPQSAQRP